MHVADALALGQNFNDYGTAEASIATAIDLNHATPIGRLNLIRTKLAVGGQRHPTTRCRSARGKAWERALSCSHTIWGCLIQNHAEQLAGSLTQQAKNV